MTDPAVPIMTYRRVPQCRICSQPSLVAQIDLALLSHTPYNGVVEQFRDQFPIDKPLTKAVVYQHFQHMKEAIQQAAIILHGDEAAMAARAAQATSTSASGGAATVPPTLSPHNTPHTPASQQIFQGAVLRELDEIDTIQFLVQSGLDDLRALTPTSSEPEAVYELDKKLARNKVRVDTAKIVGESAKIKKMAADTNDQQARVEKGRLVFKMFAILRDVLLVVPAEYRPLVSEELKQAFRRDDELQELLKVHTTPGVS